MGNKDSKLKSSSVIQIQFNSTERAFNTSMPIVGSVLVKSDEIGSKSGKEAAKLEMLQNVNDVTLTLRMELQSGK